jgi:HPr kinase/phosphorylase
MSSERRTSEKPLEEPFRKESISVEFLVEQLRRAVSVPLETVVEGDLQRLVVESNLHRPGLALAGYIDLFTYQRVQILGNTESQYLQKLSLEDRRLAFEHLIQFQIPCIFITDSNTIDPDLIEMARERGVPVLATTVPSTQFASLLGDFLEDQFAPQQTLHASLVDVYGVGILLTGKAGIGKSEVALDLVERGHRLVADDVVIATRKGANVIMGSGTDLVQHFMEIRGLGIVDVRAMFGIRAIRFQKRIEVVVDLHVWKKDEEYTRLGMVEDHVSILDVPLPRVKLPIVPGKNITVICEVVAMNYLLQHYGYVAKDVLADRLSARIEDKTRSKQEDLRRGIEYFEHDTE